MPRILILYFSLSGSTARVAEAMAFGLRAKACRVDLCNLKDERPPRLDGYDLLGIGSPAYYFRPPFNVMDYLNNLPDFEGLPSFVFTLHGTYPGDAGNAIRKALEKKGSNVLGYFPCHGADLFVGYLKAGILFSPDHPNREELLQAEEFGRKIATIMAGEGYTKPQNDPPPSLIYMVERFVTNRFLARTIFTRLFRVNKKKCSSCGLCSQECPAQNIAMHQKGYPVWNNHCLLCFHCQMQCPEESISSPMSWLIFQPVIHYNISQATQDAAIEHARVEHNNGETTRL